MSGLTHERQLKRENGTKYWIDIRAFNRKMHWPCGREIYSRRFKISESVFTIHIYPNGNESSASSEKGHVAVFLQNESGWTVGCAITFSVNGHKKTAKNRYIVQDQGWGFPRFASHQEMKEKELLNKHGGLTLEVDVQVLWEQVTPSRMLVSDALQTLQIEVSAIKEELEEQRREIKYMKGEICRKMTNFGKALNMIAYKMSANSDPRPSLTVASSSGPSKGIQNSMVLGEGSDPIVERPSLTVTSSSGPSKKITDPLVPGEGPDPIVKMPSVTSSRGPAKKIKYPSFHGEGADPIMEWPSLTETYPSGPTKEIKYPSALGKGFMTASHAAAMYPGDLGMAKTTEDMKRDLICRPNCVTS